MTAIGQDLEHLVVIDSEKAWLSVTDSDYYFTFC
jgi:hypothetical protein